MQKLVRLGESLNAFRFSFDETLLDEIRQSYQGLTDYLNAEENQALFVGGESHDRAMVQADSRYQLVSYGAYPLLWLSTNDEATFNVYRRFFDALKISDDIKTLVDYDERIVMYCGFLVVGDRAPKPLWHVDYEDGANGFTLITPLFELDAEHGNLLYRQHNGETGHYEYQLGEAVVFGDRFLHSTEAYPMASQKRVLVSLTFGTDKMQYWDILKNTIGDQSDYLVLPCGHVQDKCNCGLTSD